jgi:sugar lactone lactonase YvrE
MFTQLFRAALPFVLILGSAAPASAAPGKAAPASIVLPGATAAEGIAAGQGNIFYAGDLNTGDIFRGDVRKGTASLFIDAPQGRQALGMKVDVRHHLLFVAGGFTGQAYAYDTRTGATVATYQMGTPGSSIINDVTLTPQGAWFTDSVQAHLNFVPVSGHGIPGPFVTLPVTGPAADTGDQFNLNGIAATPDGHRLIVAHTGNAELYTVDPQTGASALIAGVNVPNVDGIVLRGHDVWAVQNFSNQITRFRLDAHFTSGHLEKTITSPLFEVPTTAALFGSILAAVNAKFDTGLPPTATQFEVILVRA